MLGVFAPGQGTQTSEAAADRAGAFDSQRDMFAALLSDVQSIRDDKQLLEYYRPISFEPLAKEDIASEIQPRPDVRIVRDKIHFVPRVYGETREAAMFGAGYARAEDRLWQMDVNRHIWRAKLIELLGRGKNDKNLKQDLIVAQRNDYDEDELLKMFEQLDERYGKWGAIVQQDLSAYVDGINAYIEKVKNDRKFLPSEFRERSIYPNDWHVTDFIAEAAHSALAYHKGYGKLLGLREVGNARLLQQLQLKYGEEKGSKVFEDIRNRDNPDTITLLEKRHKNNRYKDDPDALALPDLGSFELLDPSKGFVPLGNSLRKRESGRSNALLIGGQHTTTGRPISIQGPQDGFSYPHFYDSEIQISAPDLAAHGLLEHYGPYPFNGGRGINFAVSLTAQAPDTADIFVLRTCSDDQSEGQEAKIRYLYKGKCIPADEKYRTRNIFGENEPIVFRTLRSVYGPIIGRATVDGKTVFLTQARSTWFQEIGSLIGYARLATPSATKTVKDQLAAIEFVQNQLSHYFITKDSIAHAEASFVPIRAKGVTGDFPVWGNGQWDWQGFNPKTKEYKRVPFKDHPKIINPKNGILAGWNSQIAPGWSVADNVFTRGPYHRKPILEREINRVLKTGKASRADIVRAHTLAQVVDTTWALLWPLIQPMVGEVDDPRLAKVLRLLEGWIEDGAYRADFDGDGLHEHGAAIHIADGWRAALSLSYSEHIFGEKIVSEMGRLNNLPRLRKTGGYYDPSREYAQWQSTLTNDLMFYLDKSRNGDLNYRYCGEGDKVRCRTFLIETLAKAIEIRSSILGSDFQNWTVPAVCTGACAKRPFADTSLQIEFQPTSNAPKLDPIPWQNRVTFEFTATFND